MTTLYHPTSNVLDGNYALYQHYKGGLYHLIYEATDEATEASVVVYRSLADGRVWVRPRASWWEILTHDKDGNETPTPRFRPVPEDPK